METLGFCITLFLLISTVLFMIMCAINEVKKEPALLLLAIPLILFFIVALSISKTMQKEGEIRGKVHKVYSEVEERYIQLEQDLLYNPTDSQIETAETLVNGWQFDINSVSKAGTLDHWDAEKIAYCNGKINRLRKVLKQVSR